ncbi:WD40-repeat-containing domain protein [Tribonema minus]|uniref:Glutamate-rich WD repeat-containing protein 1 n=1 Tax=Tribonema minus TaxID=303371 RepID=A0A836CN53_9STRA|nr:WD40-repeat-containing domain protein [Tribonema minus]
MDVDVEQAEPQSEVRTFRPGLDEVPEGEEMEYDPSAYHMYHSLRPEWPCLSFDFIRDKLGTNRVRYPHIVFAVAGTQAARGQPNKIQVMKLADLHKTQKLSADDEEDQESDDEDDNDVEPMLDHIDIAHNGGINRIRSMPQQPGVVASWSEKGSVYLTDVTHQVNALDKGGPRDTVATSLYTFKGHPDEGFAMDWSRVAEGRLLTGCCGGHIHVHEPQEGGAWATDQQASLGHTASVEELQWSPTEHTVFASASADGSVAIWDTRRWAKPMLSIDQAHGSQDVNVMSWNTSITYLLASGGDDGVFRVWDLRSFGKATPEPVAQFSWHKAPITSIEWDPNDESMLAVAGADNQVTVWDLSVEADDGDLVGGPNRDLGGIAELKLPPQLLFVHQGQHDIKELHFHPQVPGVIMTTALDGFNVWKPATVLQGGEK